MDVLQRFLPKKVVIPMKNLYHTWNEYLTAYCRVGGIIEAAPSCQANQLSSPSISYIIEPDGGI
jgi:hypothetical protein